MDSCAERDPAVVLARREEHDAVRVIPGGPQRVDASNGFALGDINHGDRAVVHPREIQEAVLDEEVLLVGAENEVMGSGSRLDRLEKAGLVQVQLVVSDLRRFDVQSSPRFAWWRGWI